VFCTTDSLEIRWGWFNHLLNSLAWVMETS